MVQEKNHGENWFRIRINGGTIELTRQYIVCSVHFINLLKKLIIVPVSFFVCVQRNAKAPDFKHKETGEALWLNESPTWVLPKLPPVKKKQESIVQQTLIETLCPCKELQVFTKSTVSIQFALIEFPIDLYFLSQQTQYNSFQWIWYKNQIRSKMNILHKCFN